MCSQLILHRILYRMLKINIERLQSTIIYSYNYTYYYIFVILIFHKYIIPVCNIFSARNNDDKRFFATKSILRTMRDYRRV